MPPTLAIIGAGNMAEAMVRGLLVAGRIPATRIIAADVSPQRRELFGSLGIRAIASAPEAAAGADLILLAVKPHQMAEVLAAIAPAAGTSALYISIAAGKPTAWIEQQLGTVGSGASGGSGGSGTERHWRVIRAMPNTPMLVGEGVAGLCRGQWATASDLAQARTLFEASAAVVEVPETMIDAVTAISGSGPAYFYFLVEQLVQAGVEMGFTADEARLLATKTALGAAKLLIASPDAPAELRRKVTSPGGTTQAAIEVMQTRGVDEALRAAFHRALERAREMAK